MYFGGKNFLITLKKQQQQQKKNNENTKFKIQNIIKKNKCKYIAIVRYILKYG